MLEDLARRTYAPRVCVPAIAPHIFRLPRKCGEYGVLRNDDSRPEDKGGRPASRTGGAEEALNKLGAQGWEPVTIRTDASATRRAPIFYFKRPKMTATAEKTGQEIGSGSRKRARRRL